MALREIESTLPPGFRFHPSDEELVCYYLCKKVANERVSGVTLVDVNLHVLEPWELPGELLTRSFHLLQYSVSVFVISSFGATHHAISIISPPFIYDSSQFLP